MIQGGWHDPSTGIVQQDTSVALPKTAGGLEAAMQIGALGRQDSIGNVGPTAKKSYLGDIPIPTHLHPEQFWHEGTSPLVTDKGINPTSGRRRVSILPPRQEMVGIEASILAEQLGLPKD
jgi:hypothetical protein